MYEIEPVVVAVKPVNVIVEEEDNKEDTVHKNDEPTNEASCDASVKVGDSKPSNSSGRPKIVPPAKAFPPVKYSYLALLQRKLEFFPGPFLHPFQLAVFGSPLLLRVRDLEGYTGRDLYTHVSKRIRRFVPNAPIALGESSSSTDRNNQEPKNPTVNKEVLAPTTRQTRRGRQHRIKTTADMECVAAGEIPRYGFRLRLISRDGSRCALCPWFACCIGCLIPCDYFPVIAMCGDSIAIDWHLSVDLNGGGFGWKTNKTESVGVQVSPHARALIKVKKHSSFDGGKKYGYSGSITLEECLDSFAQEERIPEVSSCISLVYSVEPTFIS